MISSARIRKIVFLTVLAGLVLASDQAFAQNSANLPVSANVPNHCLITATALTFDPYDPLNAADLDREATVSVRCTKGASITVSLDNGTYASGTTRRMRHATDTSEFLRYELYRNSGRTNRWGTDVADREGYTSTTAATTYPMTVYGRITAAQDVLPGAYSDTVIALVNF